MTRLLTGGVALLIGLAACGGDDGNAPVDAPPSDAAPDAPAGPFKVRASVNQLHVTHAPIATELEVVDGTGAQVAKATTDSHGSLIFRTLAAGTGYMVRTTTLTPVQEVGPLEIKSVENSQPAQSFYSSQTLTAGNHYITTRDGTQLSAFVQLPGEPSDGPYPTLVTYSGYDESRPGSMAVDQSMEGLCATLPILCAAPSNPSALIAGLFGYATVSVNMRGTGCSGGGYDYFEELQLLDGYDIIETVAAQSWVKDGKVGMVGLSYPGISQLFVASVRPPHLAAIAPMSVIGDSTSTMVPGGILNDGFASSWITEVLNRAKPYGQGWEQGQVDAGDALCAENQLLHDQYVDNIEQARAIQFYDPAQHDKYNPSTFVNKITVPVFLASAWQDEQTGPYFFTLLDKFTSAPALRMTVYNGVHVDAFQPKIVADWLDFLELYVANRVPTSHGFAGGLSPTLFDQVFHTPNLSLPDSTLMGAANVDAARAAWVAEGKLRVLFESGNGQAAGEPMPTFEHAFSQWPPNGQSVMRLYAHADGTLGTTQTTQQNAALSFTLDPAEGARTILAPGANVWDLKPDYDWEQPAAGSEVVFESAPFTSTQVMIGNASADLWLRSPVDDADLQVVLTEVRPDGQEMFVQSGTVRASVSKSGTSATALWPAPSFLQADSAKLVPGEWRQIRVGTAGFQHVFRAGSRVRVAINTPGGERALWTYKLLQFSGTTTYDIGADATHSSSLALPIVSGVTVPSQLPPCPSLRGQQCRAYQAYTNVPSAL